MITRFLILAAVALTLGGCAGKSVFEGGPSITATIANPVGRTELAAVESAYGVALTAAVNYRRFCYGGPLAAQAAVCANRRAIVLQMQAYDRKAKGAVRAARNFVRNNPNISAVSVIAAARAAVTDFQAVASTGGQ